jgi:hypothetical protein
MKKFLSDLANQLWTFLGMFIAWVVLDGSAKAVVGYFIVITFAAHVLTFRLRNPKE